MRVCVYVCVRVCICMYIYVYKPDPDPDPDPDCIAAGRYLRTIVRVSHPGAAGPESLRGGTWTPEQFVGLAIRATPNPGDPGCNDPGSK